MCKGCEHIYCSKKSKVASVAGAEQMRQRVTEDEVGQ